MSRRNARGCILVTAALGLSLVAGGCGVSATPAPAATPSPPLAATPAPAATPSPPLAATSDDADALTQNLTATAGGRSVRYPAGWIGTDNLGILYVLSSQAANDRLIGTGRLQAGDAFIQIAEYAILSGKTADPAAHLPENLALLAEGMGLTLPPPKTITSAGRPGARIDAKNDKLAMIAISLKVRDDLFADVIAYVPPGEEAARERLILSIVESLAYPPS